MERAVAIFSKLPQPGYTKSRLWETLSPEESALFHRACLHDLTKTIKNTDAVAYLYVAHEQPEEYSAPFAGTVPANFTELTRLDTTPFLLRQQQGKTLGQRMHRAFEEMLANHPQAIIIGSDLPEITATDLHVAFKMLQEHDLVLGPSSDGGYYLIGLQNIRPNLFDDIPWSTNRVYEKTLQKAREQGLSLASLPEKRDVDTWLDLLSFFQRHHHRNCQLLSYKVAHHYIQKKGGTPNEAKDF